MENRYSFDPIHPYIHSDWIKLEANKMNEAELEVEAFVTIHWYSCLPLLPPPLSFCSLMLCSSGLWNVVLGNKSIALIISLHNRGKAPLSERSPRVEDWYNLMWRENSSSIFLHTAFLEAALFYPADASGLHCLTRSLPALSRCSHNTHTHSVVAQLHPRGVSAHSWVHRCKSAETQGGHEDRKRSDTKWDVRGKEGDGDVWRACGRAVIYTLRIYG